MNGRFLLLSILVISLAFNIAVVMMHFMMPPQPRLEAHGPEAFEQRIVRDMSPSDAAIVRNAFDRHKADFADCHKIIEQAIANVRKVLASDPVNRDQLDAAMDKAREARASAELVMEQTMVDAAPLLSPDGRKKLLPPAPRDEGHGPGVSSPGFDGLPRAGAGPDGRPSPGER